MIARGVPNGKKGFQEFHNNSGNVRGERACLQPILTSRSTATRCTCSIEEDGNGPKKPHTSKYRKLKLLFSAFHHVTRFCIDGDKRSHCMRTRNSNFPNNSNVTIPRRRNKGRAPNIVEPELRTIVAPMAERTMEELLRAPTEGYGEAIVLPEINADHFEIKTNLLQLVQANPFHGLENENPHAHINSFKRITSTLRFRNVPNDVIKLMMFPYSLEGLLKLSTRKNLLIQS
ncbi:hypothetical protein Tco_1293923 [Tanacetum coccineum]